MILQAVVDKLHEIYPNLPIDIDDVEQELGQEALHVRGVRATLKREFQHRYWLRTLVHVTYIPHRGRDGFYIESMRNNLLLHLDVIENSEYYLRATQLEGDITDGVVNILAFYNVYLKRIVEPDPYMEILKQEFQTVKE